MNTNYTSSDELLNTFPRCDTFERNYSQAYQDLFALTMLRGKRNGKYVEIGSNEPEKFSNTKLLEESFGWKGISVEIDSKWAAEFNRVRTNPCYEHDATNFEWMDAIKEQKWKTKRIDYASVDCEPPNITFQSLINLPHDAGYRFSVITFETDIYKDGPEFRDVSRQFLTNLGYQLVAKDVCNGQNPYEDWWVDPEVIPETVWGPFISEGAEARDLFVE